MQGWTRRVGLCDDASRGRRPDPLAHDARAPGTPTTASPTGSESGASASGALGYVTHGRPQHAFLDLLRCAARQQLAAPATRPERLRVEAHLAASKTMTRISDYGCARHQHPALCAQASGSRDGVGSPPLAGRVSVRHCKLSTPHGGPIKPDHAPQAGLLIARPIRPRASSKAFSRTLNLLAAQDIEDSLMKRSGHFRRHWPTCCWSAGRGGSGCEGSLVRDEIVESEPENGYGSQDLIAGVFKSEALSRS